MHRRALLVIRHGETEWNRVGRWQGWLDVDLSDAGKAQALARGRWLAERAARFAAILTSDLRRAAQTAQIIATEIAGPVPEPEFGLRERAGGAFEGLDAAAIDEGWPGFRDRWRAGLEDAPPGGESDATVWDRVRLVLDRTRELPDGAVLIVTHGGVARVMHDRADTPTRSVVSNVGGRWFEWDGTRLVAGEMLDPIPDTDRTRAAIE
jgi:broad specificity phosphatase PhoE